MKKSILLIIATIFIVSCASLNNGQKKISAEQKALQIEDSIQAKSFEVDFNYVTPMSMPPHNLTSNYYLRIKGDSVQSELPYFGRAYYSNISNNDRSPLSFNSRITDIKTVKNKKNDYTIIFKTKNDTEDMEYTLNIYPNGQAYLNVNSTYREAISFNGDIDL